MNILFLCDEYPPGRHGGIGTAVQVLARELVKQNHNVCVAGFYDWGYGEEDYYEDDGVKVFRFRRDLSKSIFRSRASFFSRGLFKLFKIAGLLHRDVVRSLKKYERFLRNIIEEYHIDVIEAPDYNDYMKYCKSYIPFPALSKPLIVKLHGSIVYFAREAGQKVPDHILRMEQDLLRSSQAVVSVSHYTASKTADYLDYRKNIPVLPNGIQLAGFNDDVVKAEGRVIFTGTLIEKKGVFQLAKAWNIVNKQLHMARLDVCGKGDAKRMQDILNKQSKETVVFHGHVPRQELLYNLSCSSVAVFPSFAESFGYGPIEAMTCGTATIFSKTTSGPEIIQDGVDGLLIDPYEEKDIAKKIILLLTNKELNQRLSTAGKRSAELRFNIYNVAKEHVRFYESCLI